MFLCSSLLNLKFISYQIKRVMSNRNSVQLLIAMQLENLKRILKLYNLTNQKSPVKIEILCSYLLLCNLKT